ncbi:hypothetical protein CL614_00170 [archaeon]|nr:hypothetical protein [archaeon]
MMALVKYNEYDNAKIKQLIKCFFVIPRIGNFYYKVTSLDSEATKCLYGQKTKALQHYIRLFYKSHIGWNPPPF